MNALVEKQDRRKSYRERHGLETYGLEVYKEDKARMKRWLDEKKFKQADGFKVLLDAVFVNQ